MKLIVLMSILVSSLAVAAPCRDSKGKFVKCTPAVTAPTAPAKAKTQRCRDSKGKFIKCTQTFNN